MQLSLFRHLVQDVLCLNYTYCFSFKKSRRPERGLKKRQADPKKRAEEYLNFYEHVSLQKLNMSPQARSKIRLLSNDGLNLGKILNYIKAILAFRTHTWLCRKHFYALMNYTFDDQRWKSNVLLYRPAQQIRSLCACLHGPTAFVHKFLSKETPSILLEVLSQPILSDRFSQFHNQKGKEKLQINKHKTL